MRERDCMIPLTRTQLLMLVSLLCEEVCDGALLPETQYVVLSILEKLTYEEWKYLKEEVSKEE